jgi:ABC-type multidrug transport system ATPase subunit
MSEMKLFFYENKKLIKKIAFVKGNPLKLLIGKGNNADIFLDNPLISRNHLQLIYDEYDTLFIQDLNSTNGTFVNNIKLKSGEDYKLNNKDNIELSGKNGVSIKFEELFIEKNSTITQTNIIDKLKSKNLITIGRSIECDIVLEGSNISRKHATFEKAANGNYILKDLNSLNGTFVNGKKIKGLAEISINDKIYIGKHLLTLSGKTKDLSKELAISAVGIEKKYSNGVKALNKMDLSIPSKTLIAIMGPSGCGKSTLLKTLNGDSPASNGKVYLFDQELLSNYDYLKTQIGYVPQDDIIHEKLTVYQCMFFTAKLRLENSKNEEIEEKINTILKELNIVHIKNNLISEISGGQRKRVSIGVELLTEPLILFLDEPTSPLDPQTIEEFLNILKRLSEKGTTVIMVTHKPEDLEYMDEVIFLADGGHIAYFGDSKKYKNYFNVNTAVSVFSQISGDTASFWVDKYSNPNPINTSITSSGSIKNISSVNSFKQFYWLSRRYYNIKTNDVLNSLMMLIQAPIIAVLICVIFANITAAVLFITALSAIWFGTNNAAREIVSETAIFKRERMFNLKIMPYIMSKICVLSFFSIIQSAIFILILYLKYNSNSLIFHNPIKAFIWMSFLSISACFLGLLLSSTLKSAEKVMTVVPIILIPQIMFAGLVTKIEGPIVEFISYLTLSRWGTEGFNAIQIDIYNEIINNKENAINRLLSQFDRELYVDLFGSLAGTIKLDFIVISLMIILMLIPIYLVLKNKVEVLK